MKTILRLINWSKFSRNKLAFVLSFEYNTCWTSYKQYYLPRVEITDYNVMMDGQNFFDQPVKNYFRTFDNAW